MCRLHYGFMLGCREPASCRPLTFSVYSYCNTFSECSQKKGAHPYDSKSALFAKIGLKCSCMHVFYISDLIFNILHKWAFEQLNCSFAAFAWCCHFGQHQVWFVNKTILISFSSSSIDDLIVYVAGRVVNKMKKTQAIYQFNDKIFTKFSVIFRHI